MIGNLSIYNITKKLYRPYPTMSSADIMFFTPYWKTFTEITNSSLDNNNVFPLTEIVDVQPLEGKNDLIKSSGGYSYSTPQTKEIYTVKCFLDIDSVEKIRQIQYKDLRLLVWDKNQSLYSKTSSTLFVGIKCEIIRVYSPNLGNGIDPNFTEIDIQISESFDTITKLTGLNSYSFTYTEFEEVDVLVTYLNSEAALRFITESGDNIII